MLGWRAAARVTGTREEKMPGGADQINSRPVAEAQAMTIVPTLPIFSLLSIRTHEPEGSSSVWPSPSVRQRCCTELHTHTTQDRQPAETSEPAPPLLCLANIRVHGRTSRKEDTAIGRWVRKTVCVLRWRLEGRLCGHNALVGATILMWSTRPRIGMIRAVCLRPVD